jgi:hypothetical protein
MASINFLNRIDTYVQELLDNGAKLSEPQYAEELAKKFKLDIVSVDGTTRIILKKKGSRTVIKVGYPCHNRAEYATYKALEYSTLGDLLAPCLGVSNGGLALEMAFIPKAIPRARGQYYWFNPGFVKMRDKLESHFAFIKEYNKYAWGADFHEENMRVMRNGNIKIIDYSNLLADMFSRRSTTTVNKAIRGICKLDFPRVNIKLTLKDRVISYKDNDSSYEIAIDPQEGEAII